MKALTRVLLESPATGVKIIPFHEDLDDAYDWYDQAVAVFKECRIGVNRDKDLSLIALNDEEIVGAVFSSSSLEQEGESDYVEYSFDAAVKPQFQQRGIGTALVSHAIRLASEEGGEFPVKVRVWVVNPSMERVLERLGFSDGDEERHEGGSCHMEKWL